ncbi:MAG: hypothetical protein ACE5L7_07345, partial [Candidatus Aminicenantales bacterium]
IIYIRKANVIYTGDLYLSNGFPIIDIYHGGSVNGYIEAVGKIIELCDEDTRIVPGHGEISDREGLRAYHEMLTIARDRIHKLIKAGKTLEEVLAANPTKNLYKGGKSWLSPKLFIYVVYQELSRSKQYTKDSQATCYEKSQNRKHPRGIILFLPVFPLLKGICIYLEGWKGKTKESVEINCLFQLSENAL